jgi:hypothetical protein
MQDNEDDSGLGDIELSSMRGGVGRGTKNKGSISAAKTSKSIKPPRRGSDRAWSPSQKERAAMGRHKPDGAGFQTKRIKAAHWDWERIGRGQQNGLWTVAPTFRGRAFFRLAEKTGLSHWNYWRALQNKDANTYVIEISNVILEGTIEKLCRRL